MKQAMHTLGAGLWRPAALGMLIAGGLIGPATLCPGAAQPTPVSLKPMPRGVTLNPLPKEEPKPTPTPAPTRTPEKVRITLVKPVEPEAEEADQEQATPTPRVTPRPTAKPAQVAKTAPRPTPAAVAKVSPKGGAQKGSAGRPAQPAKPTPTAQPTKPVEVAKQTPANENANTNAEAGPGPATMKAALDATPSVQAKARLEQLVARTKQPASLYVLSMRLGDVDMKLGDAAAAQAAYETGLKAATSPDTSKQAGEKLAFAAAANNDFTAAARQWAVLRMQGGTPAPQALRAEALALAAQSDYKHSEEIWGQVDSKSAGASAEFKAEAILGQGMTAELQGKTEEAQQFYRRVEKDFANSPQAALAKKRLSDLLEPIIPLN